MKGLYLQDFDRSKIKTSKIAQSEMERLKKDMSIEEPVDPLSLSNNVWTKIRHINIRSLLLRFQDLMTYTNLTACDIICISETWLSYNVSSEMVALPGFVFHRRDRKDSYEHHNCSENCLKCNK